MLAMECSGYRGLEDLSGGDSDGEQPVPIPNTEVKPVCADGTWGATPWESRSPPDINLEEAVTPYRVAASLRFNPELANV